MIWIVAGYNKFDSLYNMLMAENTKISGAPEPGWSYKPGDNQAQPPSQASSQPLSSEQSPADAPHPDTMRSVSWTASEFVANHKGANWHLSYFLFLIVFLAVILLTTKDIISTVSIGVVLALFIIIANRKPRQLAYELNNSGVQIADKFYPYDHFKSFSVSDDGAVESINFMPLKRFMPEISIYFPPDEGDKIIAILTDHLPHDQVAENKIDKLFKKLHF